MKRTEQEIMQDIRRCYCWLSPENLWMDGEATKAQARKREKQITTELKKLFKELGREVGEGEAYGY